MKKPPSYSFLSLDASALGYGFPAPRISEIPMNAIAPRIATGRVLGITAGLSVAGAVAGSVVGVGMTLITGGFHGAASVAHVLLAPAAVGAACGAVFFPVGAWMLMRRVPLGRALLWTLAPSALGAAAGLGFIGMTAPIGIGGAAIGFVAAALGARRSVRDVSVAPGRAE